MDFCIAAGTWYCCNTRHKPSDVVSAAGTTALLRTCHRGLNQTQGLQIPSLLSPSLSLLSLFPQGCCPLSACCCCLLSAFSPVTFSPVTSALRRGAGVLCVCVRSSSSSSSREKRDIWAHAGSAKSRERESFAAVAPYLYLLIIRNTEAGRQQQ